MKQPCTYSYKDLRAVNPLYDPSLDKIPMATISRATGCAHGRSVRDIVVGYTSDTGSNVAFTLRQ